MYFINKRQYAINNNYSNAISYYDKVIDSLKATPQPNGDDEKNLLNKNYVQDQKLLIEIYEDKAKIEQFKENNDLAVDIVKKAILTAEKM